MNNPASELMFDSEWIQKNPEENLRILKKLYNKIIFKLTPIH